MKVDTSNARTVEEEYDYWFQKIHCYIDEKLPWDMHPNELRAEAMYKAKLKRKLAEALVQVSLEERS